MFFTVAAIQNRFWIAHTWPTAGETGNFGLEAELGRPSPTHALPMTFIFPSFAHRKCKNSAASG
jgi:hypothetical protein